MVLLKKLVALLPLGVGIGATVSPDRSPDVDLRSPKSVDVKYGPSTSTAAFSLNLPSGQSFLELLVASADDPCAEGNVSLNGVPLKIEHSVPVSVHETQILVGRGSGFLPHGTNNAVHMRWQSLCLSSPDTQFETLRPTKLLSVELARKQGDRDTGFVISYRQRDKPRFVRIEQQYIDIENPGFDFDSWQDHEPLATTVGKELDVDSTAEASEDDNAFEADPELIQSEQYRELFDSLIHHIKEKLKAVKSKAHKIFTCHSSGIDGVGKTLDKVESAFQSHSHQQSALGSFLSDSDKSSSTFHADETQPHAPSQTRSLTPTSTSTSNVQYESSSSAQNPLSISHHRINLRVVSVLFPCLVLSSVLLWLFLRFRDPRRRAERAAEKEERRNRKLYRRAARCHKWRTFICRMRGHEHPGNCCGDSPSSGEAGLGVTGGWNEKRSRVLQQETLLDAVTSNEVRQLCHQTALPGRRPYLVSATVAAEEGYAFPDSRSMRSVRSSRSFRRTRRPSGESSSTLPDYVTDITQPPGYDEEIGLEEALASNGWRYDAQIRTRTRTPDSSVVDTSTRDSVRSSRSGSLDLGGKV